MRVRALRDAVAAAALHLQDNRLILLEDVTSAVHKSLGGVLLGDLGAEEVSIRLQLAAFLERIAGLLPTHGGLVPSSDLGLPGDARFLGDMGRFLTRQYGIED